jgi:hypothetical protein
MNSRKENIHTLGYQIIPQAIQLDDRVVPFVQKVSGEKMLYIFNNNEMSRNDFKRRQKNLPIRSQYMKSFDTQVKNIIKTEINTTLVPTDPVILHSKPGCQPQAAHCDYLPDDNLKKVSNEQMPLAALISLMPNTRLKVWPHSSHLALKEQEELKEEKVIPCREIHLNSGDMVIFRGDFVHAGSGYTQDNFRIHYYLDSPTVPREKNRTWLIKESGN